MDFQGSLNKWVNALSRPEEYFKRAIVENQEEILDLNIAQLDAGQDALGNLLMEYASEEYAQFKKALGSKAPFGIPDLKLEGDFREGFVLLVEGNEFRIDSTDEKAFDLSNKYGQDIFGLQEKSLQIIRPELLRVWVNQFLKDVA